MKSLQTCDLLPLVVASDLTTLLLLRAGLKRGGDDQSCGLARKWARGICPNDWLEKWDDEREAGNFAGVSMD